VCGRASSASFPLVSNGGPAAIWTDAGDWPGVLRAATSFQADLAKLSGIAPQRLSAGAPRRGPVVVVGTIGRSAEIDRLIAEGKLDVSGVTGEWEAFVHHVVESPWPGVDRALVVAGADKRGTVFGVYDLAERMGVSPWSWWADVAVPVRREVHVAAGRRVEKPAVRYRGIFLNDENPALYGWVNETFGGFNHGFYERVFDLILRLKGNYLWPAMWGKAFADDDPLNAELADEYGVVIGTSHHEPMMRAHVEWERYGAGPWNYATNPERLRAFWRKGVERMGAHESLVTVGMRGDGDEPMTEGTATELLERIVADQRAIIEGVTGKPAAETPQIWALYKEVQDYYEKGMRVPEDVTLLFADDNWGNVRRLPEPGSKRPGGYGVYYHFDYVGGPRNYKWLNTNQIERTWEQMKLSYDHGADRLWIVNVGDLKPMEFPTEFFLDHAWKPDAMTAERVAAYPKDWAEQQFGAEHAEEIGALLTGYTRFNARRKPELIGPETFSLLHDREAERVLADWRALERRAEAVNAALAPEHRDAFFQLVLFPIQASANLNALYVAAAKNRLYAAQGRASANAWAAEVERLFAFDAELERRFHQDLAGGKWNHMMSQTRIGYTGWQQPDTNVMPAVTRVAPAAAPSLGVAIEGRAEALKAGQTATLPPLDRWSPAPRWIEVFDRGSGLRWTAQAGAPWLNLSATEGGGADARIEVSIDWTRAPEGEASAPVTVRGSDGAVATVLVPISNPTERPKRGSFVETGGAIVVEAESFARKVEPKGAVWTTIANLGRTKSGVTALPATGEALTPGGRSPRLEYDVWLWDAGEVEVRVAISPTLDFRGQGGLRYAVSIDDEPPQIVNVHPDPSEAAWERSVADAIKVLTTKHRVRRPGARTVKLWLVDPGLVFQRVTVATRPLPESYLGPVESRRAP
jgi:hypothetical protein